MGELDGMWIVSLNKTAFKKVYIYIYICVCMYVYDRKTNRHENNEHQKSE